MRPTRIHAIALLAAFLILVGLVQTTRDGIGFLGPALPVLRLWPDTAAQQRRQLGNDLWEMLAAADRTLPRDTGVLLVTSGTDPRHEGYVAYHRALYHLAPRPVWWTNSAPSDGTWEARWWITSPLTATAIRSVAEGRRVRQIIFYRTEPPAALGPRLALTPHAWLVSLDGETLPAVSQDSGRDTDGSPLALIVGVLAVFAAGLALVGLAVRLGYRPTWIEAIALAWPLGAGAVSLGMFWLSTVGLALAAQTWAISTVALAGVSAAAIPMIRARLRGPRRPSTLSGGPSRWLPDLARIPRILLHALLVLLIVASVGVVGLLAIGRPLLYWDSWVTYAMKARIVLADGRVTEHLISDPSRVVTNQDYPLLLSLVEVWLFRWNGAFEDRLAGLAAALYFAALLGIVFAALRQRRVGLLLALAFTAALALTSDLFGIALLAYADLPLAVYATLAASEVLEWLETRSPGALLIAAMAAGLLPWTKREGIVLLAVLCVAIVLVGWRRRAAWLAVGALALSALLLSGPWWGLVIWNGVTNAAFAPPDPATFIAHADRISVIAQFAYPRLISPDWSYLWPLVPLLAAIRLFTRERPGRVVDLLPTAAALYLGVMCCAYVFSTYAPYQQHILSSVDRLLAHVVALPLIWMGCLGTRPAQTGARGPR